MRLSQAASYFNSVPLEGLVNNVWEPLFVSCNLLSYDRFIGPRVFGHEQRIALVGPKNQIPPTVEFVRTPEPRIYLILSMNPDIRGTETYAYSYILQQALSTARLITFSSVTAPSGLGGTKIETLGDPFFCSLSRYSSEGSSELDSVKYPQFTILCPNSLDVDTDQEVEIGNTRYVIKECNPMLSVKELRCTKLGVAP